MRWRQPVRRQAWLGAEWLEVRLALAGPTQLTIPLDPTLDQFGDQVETIQAFGDSSRAAFGLFDTGASAITFSAADQEIFDFLGGPIPIKAPGGARAEGVGGSVTGDVSQPGKVLADGLHASSLTFDRQGFPIFNINLDSGSAAADGVQAFVGTFSGSPLLPTITGTPLLNPSQANPNGLAARIDLQGELLDFSDVIPGLKLAVPDVHFVAANAPLAAASGTTDPVTVPLELFGGDNHTNPGNSITE